MFSVIYDLLELLKGPRTLVPVEVINDTNHRYEILLSDGSYLYFFCNEIKYNLQYNRWWVPNKDIIQYHVFSSITNSNNDVIKKNFEDKELYVTNIYHNRGSIEKQKKYAIQALIDIITHQATNQ